MYNNWRVLHLNTQMAKILHLCSKSKKRNGRDEINELFSFLKRNIFQRFNKGTLPLFCLIITILSYLFYLNSIRRCLKIQDVIDHFILYCDGI